MQVTIISTSIIMDVEDVSFLDWTWYIVDEEEALQSNHTKCIIIIQCVWFDDIKG